jgi:hypothetical protein
MQQRLEKEGSVLHKNVQKGKATARNILSVETTPRPIGELMQRGSDRTDHRVFGRRHAKEHYRRHHPMKKVASKTNRRERELAE